MEISINGRNVGITDRFRDYATEKSEKIARYCDRWILVALALGFLAYAADQAIHAWCRRIRPVM